MQTKFIVIIICIIISVPISIIFLNNPLVVPKSSTEQYVPLLLPDSIFLIETPKQFLEPDIDSRERYINMRFTLDPQNSSIYEKIGLDNNAVVIYPTFTETAYSDNGFYDYYENECDESCLTVKLKENFRGEFESGKAAYHALKALGYTVITDIDVDKNPSLINDYEKIILLHNEYVTKSMFNAVISHPKVIYLYPNALYAEISVDYDQETISLVRGHNYPNDEITNGFNWQFDNTRTYEYNTQCINWEFYEIENGWMLNCYPEYIMHKDIELLKKIAEL